MHDLELTVPADNESHLSWVRTRMTLAQELLESIRYGFSLIAAGFGSFAVFEGLTIGELRVTPLPKTFALIVTVVGVIVIVEGIVHDRKMTAWVDADEFGTEPVPALPNENRPRNLGIAAVLIGVVSFVALLLLPS